MYVCAVCIRMYLTNTFNDGQDSFRGVFSSMFSLFQVTTLDNWFDVAEPLLKEGVAWHIFFICFIGFSAWLMISLLTGVVSDTMIQATQNRKEVERRRQENNRLAFIKFLEDSFNSGDTDGNGVLDRQEFDELIKDDMITKKKWRSWACLFLVRNWDARSTC